MNDKLPNVPENKSVSMSEYFKYTALDDVSAVLIQQIQYLADDDVSVVLNRILGFITLLKQADTCYYEMLNLIEKLEFQLMDEMGYKYEKDSNGFVILSSALARCDEIESSSKQLTEAEYYNVLDLMHKSFMENGIPENFKPAYANMCDTLRKLMDDETIFVNSMAIARPYLNCVEGTFLTSQYYTEIQLLLSVKRMFETYNN